MESEVNSFTLSEESEIQYSIEELTFIFSQAEKQLDESEKSSSDVLGRTNTILGIASGLFISLSIFFIEHFSKNNKVDSISATALILSLYMCYVIYVIKYNVKGHDYQTLGSRPADLMHDWFTFNYPDKDQRRKVTLI